MAVEFHELMEICTLVAEGFSGDWFAVGGWAIDLFLGRETRVHGDLELGVFRRQQLEFRSSFAGWEFVKVSRGVSSGWAPGEFLQLPEHEIHARLPGLPGFALEILLQEESESDWLFRRNQSISMKKSAIVLRGSEGIPYLRPEIVLLYKAKELREKDQRDFDLACAVMTDEQKQWLRQALEICHAGHVWLPALASSRSIGRQ